jgi:hypothetical protein
MQTIRSSASIDGSSGDVVMKKNDPRIGWIAWIAAALGIVVVGCGPSLPTTPVQGVVVFNGTAVSEANLAFVREDGNGVAAFAITDATGRFKPRTGKYWGMVPGKYVVTVQKDDSASLNIPNPIPKGMSMVEYMASHNLTTGSLLPLRYSNTQETPLRVEVLADSKNDFELKLEGVVSAAR